MSLIAIVLLAISAGTHAGWNLVGKRQHPTAAFFLVANIFGTLGLLPVFFHNWGKLAVIPHEIYGLSMIAGFSVFCILPRLPQPTGRETCPLPIPCLYRYPSSWSCFFHW